MQQGEENYQEAVLALPRLRVQNANAISSPMTWGFPSITAFIGLMHALARRLQPASGLEFLGVGVICHDFEAQITENGYTRAFRLTRNPVKKNGSTAAIVEEGRIHLDITLVFLVNLAVSRSAESQRQQLAQQVKNAVAEMRIAGGSVLPSLPGVQRREDPPQLRLLANDEEERRKDFRRMRYRWLPGFALVARDDLLQERLVVLQQTDTKATVLDAWLDLSRLNHRAVRTTRVDENTGESIEVIKWEPEPVQGWTVPIPVGYAGLSELHAAGSVANARDATTQFQFVESMYSIGQWISPHRLEDVNDLLWYGQHDEFKRLYHCRNDYRPTAQCQLT